MAIGGRGSHLLKAMHEDIYISRAAVQPTNVRSVPTQTTTTKKETVCTAALLDQSYMTEGNADTIKTIQGVFSEPQGMYVRHHRGDH